ncbi:hypothetical protein FQN50_005876 [Emmonsiellopsis sp. PD_5]|nr:hypothetical protein FQN50_005876 [Emmonsiellopsis sp. PD_5]
MSIPTDPASGKPLPADAIQRVLFICNPVHVYAIPPLTSMKGYTAADWTVPDPKNNNQTRQIFTARLRVLETAIPSPSPAPSSQASQLQGRSAGGGSPADVGEKVKTDILLEDPSNGNLFAAAPYTDAAAVEHALDSSRFFAIRVIGDGRKAMLGIGFEDRSEAFDFGVTLQEARKVLGFGLAAEQQGGAASGKVGGGGARGLAPRGRIGVGGPGALQQHHQQKLTPEKPASSPKDYSLKPGQTISINFGGKKAGGGGGGNNSVLLGQDQQPVQSPATAAKEEQTALFSIPPPPPPASRVENNNFDNNSGGFGDSGAGFPMIPPPPSSSGNRRRRPQSMLNVEETKVVQGFDDDGGGEFGDFQ